MFGESHVNAVSVFKGYVDDQSIPEDHIRCLFLFQVTTTHTTNTNKVLEKISKTRLVDHIVEHRVSLNDQVYLSELVEYAVNHTRLFTSGRCLAQQIVSNILSRFEFSTATPSFTSILFAVNVDRIFTHYKNLMPSRGLDIGGSSVDNEVVPWWTWKLMKSSASMELKFDSNDSCSICLEEYGSDCSEVVRAESSDCSDVFHRDCICQWLRKSTKCPTCRSVFLAQI